MLEALGIEATRLDAEQVAARAGHEEGAGFPLPPARLERLAELRDVDLERAHRRRRRPRAPEVVDEAIGRDDPVRVQQEDRKERPLLGRCERDTTTVVADLQWPEDAELHLYSLPLTVPEIPPPSAPLKRPFGAGVEAPRRLSS